MWESRKELSTFFRFCLLLVRGSEPKDLWTVGKWALPHLQELLSSQQKTFPVVFWFGESYLEVISFKYFRSQINKWLNSLLWDGWVDLYVLACKPSFLPTDFPARGIENACCPLCLGSCPHPHPFLCPFPTPYFVSLWLSHRMSCWKAKDVSPWYPHDEEEDKALFKREWPRQILE